MLVLSRERDETIMIGDDIELTVVDIKGDKVRLGIKAPSNVAVHRKEIYDAIKRENEAAAAAGLEVSPHKVKSEDRGHHGSKKGHPGQRKGRQDQSAGRSDNADGKPRSSSKTEESGQYHEAA